jgi:hypothetical protein
MVADLEVDGRPWIKECPALDPASRPFDWMSGRVMAKDTGFAGPRGFFSGLGPSGLTQDLLPDDARLHPVPGQ